MTAPLQLFPSDQRLQTLLDALAEVLYERGQGLPLPSILGIIRLLEHEVIENAKLN